MSPSTRFRIGLRIALRITFLAAAAAAAATTLPAAAAGSVEVQYIEPENFSDSGRNAIDREQTLKLMTAYLQSLGAQLPQGQTLRLEVTDLDLAGNVEPFGWHSSGEVRVMRGRADWPHMNLRYTLLAAGQVLKSGQAKLADIGYSYSLRGREQTRANDTLAYEKPMVQRWFAETILSR